MAPFKTGLAGGPCRCGFGVPGLLPPRKRTAAVARPATPSWLLLGSVNAAQRLQDEWAPPDSQVANVLEFPAPVHRALASLPDVSQLTGPAGEFHRSALALSGQLSALPSQLSQRLPEVTGGLASQSNAAMKQLTNLAPHLSMDAMPNFSSQLDSVTASFKQAISSASVDPILSNPAAAGGAGIAALATLALLGAALRSSGGDRAAASSRAPGSSPTSNASGRPVTESKMLDDAAAGTRTRGRNGAGAGVVEIAYVSGWEAPMVHGCVAGQEWTTWPMERAGEHLKMSAQVPANSDNGAGNVFEFVITDGSGNWDKPPTGENYVVAEPGTFELRDGNLNKLGE